MRKSALPARFGRPACGASVGLSAETSSARLDRFICGVKREKTAVCPSFFLFLCPDRKQNNGGSGKWGLELEIPLALSLAYSLWVDLAHRHGRVWARARSEVKANTHEEAPLCARLVKP